MSLAERNPKTCVICNEPLHGSSSTLSVQIHRTGPDPRAAVALDIAICPKCRTAIVQDQFRVETYLHN